MRAKREFRDRPETEVAVLDALVDRAEDGMTVLELRSSVGEDIDTIESALTALTEDGLIDAEREGTRLTIYPADRVVPDPADAADPDRGLVDAVRDRLGL
jgi:DNA-binding transcriptional ArsR family regulator